MNSWQAWLLIFIGFNAVVFIKAWKECKTKNAYGATWMLYPLGMFVWGDALIFSVFWIGISLVCLLFSKVYLFLLGISLFWAIRSFGETIYWFNQQFSTIQREDPQKVKFYSFFQNDSVWFIHQIAHQCITVIALLSSIYFASVWITSGFK